MSRAHCTFINAPFLALAFWFQCPCLCICCSFQLKCPPPHPSACEFYLSSGLHIHIILSLMLLLHSSIGLSALVLQFQRTLHLRLQKHLSPIYQCVHCLSRQDMSFISNIFLLVYCLACSKGSMNIC